MFSQVGNEITPEEMKDKLKEKDLEITNLRTKNAKLEVDRALMEQIFQTKLEKVWNEGKERGKQNMLEEIKQITNLPIYEKEPTRALEKTIIFGVALALTIFFFGSLVTWCVYSIAPKSFGKKFNPNRQIAATWCMFVAIILWSILYYYSI